ncbi:hypothetical protein HLI_06820 [Halobacillus litoralis]|uniref:Uncharacterized protein n=1 Tax=Halobacillus litoralis TaxID=45668 RepID=A0A410MB91_9BACI|nr:hypothetical protein HLI_06820 [Halobacillus litoralis]
MDTNTLLHFKDWKVLLENLETSTSQLEKVWGAVNNLCASHLHNYRQLLQRVNVFEMNEKNPR